MSEHEDRESHDAKAEELEFELAEMQERTDALEEEIAGAGEQWERRKADDGVPGAAGEPEQADGPEPEAEYPSKGGDGDGDTEPTSSADTGDLDFGRALAEDGEDEEKG
jgi:hypothetical protein